MRYDVIVVGAGPAGSTTARECAERGLSVLMLDRAEFPRDKPCGGGVTVRAADLLGLDLSPVVERVIYGTRFSERRGRSFLRTYPEKITYLTQRRYLDTFLAERAVEAGVVFRQREPVRGVERYSNHVVVRSNGHVHEGRTLVAADGANGPTAKLAGLDVKLLHGIALEGNITPANGIPQEWEQTLGFDLGGLPGGYGWLFPKADHVNIGLGGWRYIGPSLRERLDELVRFYGFDPSQLWGLKGHHLPLRQNGSPLVRGNVLLVGDAAGFIDPFTGEGIFAGIASGQAAARHIESFVSGDVADLDGYRVEIEANLLPELSLSRQIHDVFHLWPGLFLGIDRRTKVLWKAVALILRGEKTYLDVRDKLGPFWSVVELVSDMVRVLPPLRRLSGLRDPSPPERFFRKSARSRGAPF